MPAFDAGAACFRAAVRVGRARRPVTGVPDEWPSNCLFRAGDRTRLTGHLAYTHKQHSTKMALVVEEKKFQHILRILNTNVDGRQKVMFALTKIRGIGRRFSNIVCKKAGIDLRMRAGELSEEQLESIKAIINAPNQFDIPNWFLNRQKDHKTGKYEHIVSQAVDVKLREDFERMKKIRLHRGLRHFWNLRVRGQHTKSTGRHGRSSGLLKRLGLN